MQQRSRRVPIKGECACGCGSLLDTGEYFVQGHHVQAMYAIIMEQYGSIIEFVTAHQAREFRLLQFERLNEPRGRHTKRASV